MNRRREVRLQRLDRNDIPMPNDSENLMGFDGNSWELMGIKWEFMGINGN